MNVNITGHWVRGKNPVKDRIIIYLLQWLKGLTGWNFQIGNYGMHLKSMSYIMKAMAMHNNTTPEIIRSRKRKREIVQIRQTGMYFSERDTKNSLSTIGSYFGGYDHATVLHAKKVINNLMETDKVFRADIEAIDAKYFK